MFARILHMALKPGQGDAYARAMEQKVIPALQKFKGFRDEIVMVSADGTEGGAISVWDRKEDAEAFESASYADVIKTVEPFMAGAPEVHKYQVTTSTVHEKAASARATR